MNKQMIDLENGECNDCNRAKTQIANMFPYIKKATRLLTEKDINIIISGDITGITKLYNEIFSESLIECDCPDVYRKVIEQLQILKQYQDK